MRPELTASSLCGGGSHERAGRWEEQALSARSTRRLGGAPGEEQGADRLAKRNIEGEDERAQEDRTEDQDAARRAGKACERITLRPADRAAAVSEGDIEEAERTEQEERDPQTTAPGHRLDPGHEQLAGGNQCRQDDEDHAPAKQANQSAPEQVHGRARPLERDGEHQQASQKEEGDPGEFALLGFRHLQLRQA